MIMKKEIFIIAIKLLILFWLFLLGIFVFASCSSSQNVEVTGITRIHVTDTTYVKHNGFIRSKNYLPYE